MPVTAVNPNAEAPLSTSLWRAALDPLPSASRAEVITRRLQRAIALGLLPDGSPLPSETELASRMQVSTVTLRASLAELRRQGLIVTRRGRSGGSFIRLPEGPDEQPLRSQLMEMKIDDIRDLRDLHTAIAGQAARLAAERAQGRATDRLERWATAIDSATSASSAVRADFAFHAELAASTRSAQLTHSELAIQTELTPLLWIPGSEVLTPAGACRDHTDIVAAVRAGDGAAARTLAEDHVAAALNGLIELRMRMGRGA
jgi:GntR family transcriptional repressor for pyruvate dehydrogenase complex